MMYSGRPDWWRGILPGINILGEGQSDWYAYGTKGILPGVEDTVIEYTVPAGYILHITNGLVSCTEPGIQYLTIYIDDIQPLVMHYDQIQAFPFGVGGAQVLSEEHTLKVKATNNDEITVAVNVTLYGFEEYKL